MCDEKGAISALMKHLIMILAAVSPAISTYATGANVLLNNSQQLMVVTSRDWDSSHAKLQRYQRRNTDQPWHPIGGSIDIMLGKEGMAKTKKEGDLRVPSGIFSLGTAFGFAIKADPNIKVPYLPITKTTVCVDDLKSPYYNQIIDSNHVAKASWHSGEQMQEKIPQYTLGIAVNYNTSKPILGAGSCIFMHVWVNPNTPTVGCIAMSETNIKQILTWLNPTKKPIVAVFPINIYDKLRSEKLPEITSN
jgi:D-alanyl-D-alanine dipeptidase